MIIQASRLLSALSIVINIGAMTIWPVIFVHDREFFLKNKSMVNHEEIHLRQQAEMLVLPFFLVYVFFFFWALIRYGNGPKAYRQIPFEQEAYDRENDLYYLNKRADWAWWKYIRTI